MKQLFSSFCSILAALLVVVSANAQITTSSMNGVVTDENGEALIGASVVAVHTPSGSKYYAATNAEGRYAIQGMRPGGPYEVTISLIGSQTVQYPDITLELGEANTVNAKLALATEELAEVLVVASTSKFASEKTGAAMNINSKKINSVPTVNRSISDIARLSPYASGMSFAGGDGRSTNFTIDGANFNNNFGLSDALPGGGNPISMDALEEVQVVIAPFDVRQTNFIGGGINAITKSGTNDLKVSAYTYYQDQNLRGNRVNGKDLGARADASKKVWGFSIGGPIIKNKLFFFANYEKTLNPGQVAKYRARQDGETAGGNVSRTLASDMQKVQNYVLQKYGYETGSYTDFAGDESNKKFLARIDWNIATGHKISVRYNDTKNVAWNIPNPNSFDGDKSGRLNNTFRLGPQSMAFANNMYSQENKVRTWSVDLNNRFSDKVSNQFLFTYSKIDDVRGSNSSPFPHIDIMQDGTVAGGPYMSLGYELFTWNNGVHNKVYTFKDDVTILLGNHKITAGLSLERQIANNAYMRNATLYYRYRNLEDFLNEATPETFCITYGWNGNKTPNAQVAFKQYAFYVQDEWNMNSKFKLTYGVRFDNLTFDEDDIKTNKATMEYTFRDGQKIDTGLWPKNRIQISPRIGFVWDIKGDKSMKLRGGTGFFQGRLPLVYFTNMPTNSGLVQNSVNYKTIYANGIQTSTDSRLEQFQKGQLGMITNVDEAIEKLGLPTELTDDKHVANSKQSGVDRNFRMPQVWKTSIAFDYQLPTSFPFSATAEFMYQKTLYGVMIDNINLKDDTDSWERFRGADNRLIYPSNVAINSGIDAPLLTNTHKGWGYTANITVNMTPAKNLDIMAAYTHTESKEVSGLPGSDPMSTWQGMITVDGPNFGTAQRSRYVVPDKVIASLNYTIPFKFEGLTDEMQFNLFYSGYSPYGYSYCYVNDMNGDGLNNDLIYIPKDETEINFVSQADADAFWKYVDQDNYLKNHKGKYAEAYAARAPWVHRFDLQWLQNFKFNIGQTTHTIQLSVNVMNIGNMLNSSWGIAKNNNISNGFSILKYEGKDNNNVPKFSMMKDDAGNYYSKSYDYNTDFDQCWKLQFGVRYIF